MPITYKIDIRGKNHRFIYDVNPKLSKLNNEEEIEQLDFISNQDLLKWGKDTVVQKSLAPTRAEFQKWKEGIDKIDSRTEPLKKSRKDRLISLISSTANIQELDPFWLTGLKDALQKNPVLIDQYIEKNPYLFDAKLNDVVQKKTASDLAPLNKEIEQKKSELDSINNKLEELKQDRQKLKSFAREEKEHEHQELEKRIEEKNNELTHLANQAFKQQEKLNEILQKIKLVDDIEKLEEKEVFLKDSIKVKEKEKKDLEASDLPEQVAKVKNYLDLMNGVYSKKATEELECKPYHFSDKPTNRKDFIAQIKTALSSLGRDYQEDEIANFLICLHNSFLTLLVGKPGAGKTSSVYLLMQALGLEENRDFLPISVARGWTSQRDLLGYYNPLSMSFQESPTKLFSFLKNNANTPLKDSPLKVVLLDEANLSPLEHYWADFLKMCDPESKKILNYLEQDGANTLLLNDNIRFMGTINHDSTTERLSPRLLDRASIITIKQDFDITLLNYKDDESLSSVLMNFSDFKDFMTGEDLTFNKEEETLFSNMKNALEKTIESTVGKVQPITLSPRKMLAMKNYCTSARLIFQQDDPNKYLDYAFAQYVLPSIEGYGESFLSRLEELQSAVRFFPQTSELLQNIIENGKVAHHSYSFFD